MSALSQPLSDGKLLLVDQLEFRANFNEASFMFRHALHNHPLFELPRLAAVAEEMLKRGDLEKFVVLGKASAADSKFRDMEPKQKLAETIRHLGSAGVWLKLTSVDTADEAYARLLRQVLKEMEDLAGFELRKQITWSSITVFLASPGMVTPYHIDHESNFLFQISGAKQVTLFDPKDRTLLTNLEIERFYAGDYEAARYREDLRGRGSSYPLVPGTVVHHPPLAPHWVQNGDEVSVSVSIGFCMPSLDRRGRIYQVNHFLRKAGLEPLPPGLSTFRDRLKIAGVGLVSNSNPTTPGEILFSGLNRVSGLARMGKKLLLGRRR